MPEHILSEVNARGLAQFEWNSLDPVIGQSDVLYVTRVQKERFEDPEVYESVRNAFIITPETLKSAKDDMIVMHPLPRVGEISMDVDDDPRAAYFRQMEYGLYVRMALLAMVLGKA
jgi:aspartate carbamoyltransferase catalytic subunit